MYTKCILKNKAHKPSLLISLHGIHVNSFCHNILFIKLERHQTNKLLKKGLLVVQFEEQQRCHVYILNDVAILLQA